MSMLSSQCERLRDRADELRMLASGMDAPYIVPSTKETMALAMQSAASEMREAADTITSLWNSLTVSEAALNKAAGNYAELGSQREKELEQLVRDIYDVAARGEFDVGEESKFSERMAKLGVVGEC